ncbi:MAG: hypothetical protein E7557_08535 [Ruminococcaceae bacterium]|nr:hypothetical protein [Oscillospiraceae bacterium]
MADLDIGSILSSLSNEDIANLKNVANSILGGGKAEENKPPQQETQKNNVPKPDLSSLGLPDMSQFSSLLPLLSALNSHDEREDFICALKPLLSEERQQKADEAMKFIKLLSIIPLLREKGIM